MSSLDLDVSAVSRRDREGSAAENWDAALGELFDLLALTGGLDESSKRPFRPNSANKPLLALTTKVALLHAKEIRDFLTARACARARRPDGDAS